MRAIPWEIEVAGEAASPLRLATGASGARRANVPGAAYKNSKDRPTRPASTFRPNGRSALEKPHGRSEWPQLARSRQPSVKWQGASEKWTVYRASGPPTLRGNRKKLARR